MDFASYAEALLSHQGREGLSVEAYASVEENGRSYPLFRVRAPGKRLCLITSGFHGEEPSGPLTLLSHLPEIAAFARSLDVGLLVYPCANPSGFEAGHRYNASGEKPNNDFLRYEVAPGKWKGELSSGEAFLRHAPALDAKLPKETALLLRELEKGPTPNAALDIHQDNYLPGIFTYAYVFGPLDAYRPMVEAAATIIPVARHRTVDEQHRSDGDGLIVSADGSVTDYYFRRGVPYTAALETTTQASPQSCAEVNLIWIRGFIRLAAQAARA